MKWIMLLATILLPWKRGNTQVADSVPAALLLAKGQCWLATSEVPLRATNCGPGGWRDGYASGGRLQVAFRFLPNNRFSLTISLQMSGYSGETVSVTEVEGEALVGANGQQAILQTRATAGVYRVTRDGNTVCGIFLPVSWPIDSPLPISGSVIKCRENAKTRIFSLLIFRSTPWWTRSVPRLLIPPGYPVFIFPTIPSIPTVEFPAIHAVFVTVERIAFRGSVVG